ncbi:MULTISPECIES: DUF4862 family protein [unclassified Isoptericola]|uniref:DUF4862 family protein n=1 Tax=unclassified Isoptericola TaxID=2623355 RepID=UPI00365B53F3
MTAGGPPEWYPALEADGVTGLEHPVHADDPDALLTLAHNLPPSWDLLLTTAPMTSSRLAGRPAYGLASGDQDGRAKAVDDVRACLDAAARVDEAAGRRRVTGIELHTAPGPAHGDPESLVRSLAELAATAPVPVPLVVEHCDAPSGNGPPDKGYLRLEDEVRAAGAAAAASGHPVRLGVNWGRSAVEGRSTSTPVEHARTAAASGLLATAVLSGTSSSAGPWGEAWRDVHVPPYGAPPLPPDGGGTRLGLAEATDFVVACGHLAVLGVKVAAPPAAPMTDRLALIRASVRVAKCALERRRHPRDSPAGFR